MTTAQQIIGEVKTSHYIKTRAGDTDGRNRMVVHGRIIDVSPRLPDPISLPELRSAGPWKRYLETPASPFRYRTVRMKNHLFQYFLLEGVLVCLGFIDLNAQSGFIEG